MIQFCKKRFAEAGNMNDNDNILNFRREFIYYLFPPVLIAANYFTFRTLSEILGKQNGYLFAMIIYWICWCLLPVFLFTTKRSRQLLLRINKPKGVQWVLLILPPLLAFIFGPFIQRISQASASILFLSLIYAVVNAFSEEFLWRGLFYSWYPANYLKAAIIPSFWFGIWHYAPLGIMGSTGGNFSFILAAIGLGLCWSAVTYRSHNIFWNIISHTLVDWSGLGVLLLINQP
jgi:membrane protease YdiL (CAAX protease family)